MIFRLSYWVSYYKNKWKENIKNYYLIESLNRVRSVLGFVHWIWNQKEVMNPYMLFVLLLWFNTSNSVKRDFLAAGDEKECFVWYPEPCPFSTCHLEKWYLATSSLWKCSPSFGDKRRYSCCLEQTIPPKVLNLIPWHHNNTQILTKMKTQSYCWCAVLQYRVKIIFHAKQSYKCNYDINVSQFNLYYKYILNFDDTR